MSKYVKFVSTYEEDFLEVDPKEFNNDSDGYAKYCLTDIYGLLYFKNKENEKPISFFRHVNPNTIRFAGFTELGDDCLSPQKGGYHHEDIAQKETIMDSYKKLSKSPVIYGFSSDNPHMKYEFFLDHVNVEESDFFKATLYRIPVTIIDHNSIFPPMSQISQPCLISGLYEGKEVIGLGSYDRYFMPKNINKDMGEDLGYICASVSGIRDDGRYELVIVTINFPNKQCGIYWLEGEKPIISYQVSMKADWQPLPYIDDGTYVYKNATFEFENVILHVNGKWGTKGFTKEPRIERHGQSQIFGTWYVGKKAYKHIISNSFIENMNCYENVLKENGLIDD